MEAKRTIALQDGQELRLWYATTHHTFHWGIEGKGQARERNEYVSRALYHKWNVRYFAIMAYQQGSKPSAKSPIWGIYRVETPPGSGNYPEGYFTLLKGNLTRLETFAQIADVVKDDPGHQHSYWTDEGLIEDYRNNEKAHLTAFCKPCPRWAYTKEAAELIKAGTIEIKPAYWWKSKKETVQEGAERSDGNSGRTLSDEARGDPEMDEAGR